MDGHEQQRQGKSLFIDFFLGAAEMLLRWGEVKTPSLPTNFRLLLAGGVGEVIWDLLSFCCPLWREARCIPNHENGGSHFLF